MAEYIGGGVRPWFRVDSFKLFADLDGFGVITFAAELIFFASTIHACLAVVFEIRAQVRRGISQGKKYIKIHLKKLKVSRRAIGRKILCFRNYLGFPPFFKKSSMGEN